MFLNTLRAHASLYRILPESNRGIVASICRVSVSISEAVVARQKMVNHLKMLTLTVFPTSLKCLTSVIFPALNTLYGNHFAEDQMTLQSRLIRYSNFQL